MTSEEILTKNRAVQVELYGEPLADIIARLGQRLGMTQGRLADVLGLSAAMLSQLSSAQRVKIGNPAVVERLRMLDQLAAEVAQGRTPPEAVSARIETARTASGVMSRTNTGTTFPDPAAGVRTVQALLRATASASELLEAAALIEPRSPAIAEFLRIYGAGRTSEALAHYARVQHVL